MRTHNWKPKKVMKAEQIKDEKGNFVLDEDGSPKLETSEVDSPFDGLVIIKVPKYTERLKYMKECGLGQKGEINQLKLIEIGISHITKVELVRKSDGVKFSSVEDLEYDKDGADVLNSIANEVIGGVSLGENLLQT